MKSYGQEQISIHQQENRCVGFVKWSTIIAVKIDKSPKIILSEKGN